MDIEQMKRDRLNIKNLVADNSNETITDSAQKANKPSIEELKKMRMNMKKGGRNSASEAKITY